MLYNSPHRSVPLCFSKSRVSVYREISSLANMTSFHSRRRAICLWGTTSTFLSSGCGDGNGFGSPGAAHSLLPGCFSWDTKWGGRKPISGEEGFLNSNTHCALYSALKHFKNITHKVGTLREWIATFPSGPVQMEIRYKNNWEGIW